MSNIDYEMVVSAKITNTPEFKVPEITTEEINVTSVDTINDIYKKVNQIRQANKSGCVKIKIPKGFGPATDTALDIFYQWDTEGPAQAVITGVGATVTAVGIVALAGLSSPVTVSGIVLAGITYSIANLLANHIYDGIYDYGEQVFDLYKNQNGKAVIDTSVSNLSDLQSLVAPLYGAAKDCDLNEIEIRVRPENENDETIVYTIEKGDTVWDLCQKYDTTYDELIELNPWLADRFSDDMSFALIRPGEKLRIPCGSSGLLGNRPTFDVPFDEAAGAGTPGADPILVDLNGDGKIGTTTLENGVYFDHEGDGFAENSAWVDRNDGILIIDKNNNGKLDGGNEVFGDNYIKSNGQKAASGFDALRDLDSNNDGIISADDEAFSQIKILKGNGEVLTLEEAGITSINLNSTNKNTVDENGNTLVSSGTFVRADGTTGDLGDFNLVVDKMMSTETGKIKVSEDVSVLPDIRSLGYVHSLHQAMMRDGSRVLNLNNIYYFNYYLNGNNNRIITAA